MKRIEKTCRLSTRILTVSAVTLLISTNVAQAEWDSVLAGEFSPDFSYGAAVSGHANEHANEHAGGAGLGHDSEGEEASGEGEETEIPSPVSGDFTSVPLGGIGVLKSTIVSNEGSSTLTSYQAGYLDELGDGANRITWPGVLDALFIDSHGRVREDGNGNGKLDASNCDADPVVRFFVTGNRAASLQRMTGSGCTTLGPLLSLNELKPIWSAQQQLAHINPVEQRGYGNRINSSVTGGRYIFTSFDGAAADFDHTVLTTSNYELFGAASVSEARDIIDFIRGNEIAGLRNRTMDSVTWRLGDIVNSVPLVVDGSSANYDTRYNDATYTAFKAQYADRRRMVYVGANDGLLHAFNGGFWNAADQSFALSADNNEVEHPLGAEIWAYAPESLLPHLKWLTETEYPHVYYVDGAPQAFDVNIFPSDDVHPNGWGTILVVGMRLGGGPIEGTFRSAYLVFDITDPELAPQLISEVTHENLKYTTSQPALVKKRAAGAGNDWLHPSQNEWQLVFGSGPNNLRDVLSDRSSYSVFQYDLISGLVSETVVHEPNSFVGGVNSTDWNDDYQDDLLYFGTVARNSGVSGTIHSGNLMRAKLGATLELSTLLNATSPIFNAPITAKDDTGASWVYVGSGVLLSPSDLGSHDSSQFFGVKEPLSSEGSLAFGTVSLSALIDTSDIVVYEDGDVDNAPTFYNGESLHTPTTFTELLHAIEGEAGWINLLDSSSSRVLSAATRFGTTLFYTTYRPGPDSAGNLGGRSELTAVHYKTGTAEQRNILTEPSTTGDEITVATVDLGPGANTQSPVVMISDGLPVIVLPKSIGGVSYFPLSGSSAIGGRKSWRILPL
ncbi:MAG: hypothetical protein JKX83_08550 [Pseudomonadales bacterium]|nr:hypothetical protein [Pseudomonadales bacterium]